MRKYSPLLLDACLLIFSFMYFRTYAPFSVIEVFDTKPMLVASEANVLEKRAAQPTEYGFLGAISSLYSEQGSVIVRFSAERGDGGTCLNHGKFLAPDATNLERGSKIPVVFWHDRCLAEQDVRWGLKYRLLGWALLIVSAVGLGHLYGYSRRLKWSR